LKNSVLSYDYDFKLIYFFLTKKFTANGKTLIKKKKKKIKLIFLFLLKIMIYYHKMNFEIFSYFSLYQIKNYF
jgi:hypothetical protein